MSATAAPAPVEVAPGVLEVDTLLGGWRETTAGYLVGGSAPVLIETGSQSSVPAVLSALGGLGIGAADLSAIVVTHIHLDHAGAVGDLAAAFPAADVYVHELGARHLVDPGRLIASAELVYGALLDSLYGRMTPTEASRVHVLSDRDPVPGSGGRLVTVDAPGHAKHHLGFLDTETGLLFSGDAVGVRLPGGGALRPATPPPDFDLDLALATLARFAALSPSRICLAHYGLLPDDPGALLEEAAGTLRAWVAVAERAEAEGRDLVEALTAAFGADYAGLPEAERARLEALNGIHSNAAGIRRFLALRRAAETEAARPETGTARSGGPG